VPRQIEIAGKRRIVFDQKKTVGETGNQLVNKNGPTRGMKSPPRMGPGEKIEGKKIKRGGEQGVMVLSKALKHKHRSKKVMA